MGDRIELQWERFKKKQHIPSEAELRKELLNAYRIDPDKIKGNTGKSKTATECKHLQNTCKRQIERLKRRII